MQAEEDQTKGNKRRKLDDIEDELMNTQGAKRTAELYQEYMEEHKRTKREGEMREEARGSSDPASYAEPEVMHIDQVMAEEWSVPETKWDDDVKDYVKTIWQVSDDMEEYAWDDINNFELPMTLVREARN